MYKRPAQILFVEAPPAHRAALAVDSAQRLGQGWLQARAACVGDGPGASCPALDAEALAWADLVVTFDTAAGRACDGRAKRCKHWALDEGQGTEVAAAIDRQVASMVGGLRMLARSDPAGQAQEAEERGSTGSG